MCVCTAVSAGFCLNTYCVRSCNKFLDTDFKAIQTRLTFNYGEFAIIKIRVVYFLPNPDIFKRISIAKPISDKKIPIFSLQHISQTQIILIIYPTNIYFSIFHNQFTHITFLSNKHIVNDNLLQQARALYQAWFVDYAPFNGVRPSDWIDDTIDGLAKEVICGKTPSTKVSEYYGNDVPFITIPDMHGNTYAVTTERYLSSYGAQSQPKKTLPRNSICVSCIGTAGLVTLTAQESQTNQQINSIIPKEGYSPYYIYLLMETLSVIINNLGQSGSTIVNLNKAQFGKIAVVIPSIEIMKSFDEIVSPMFESILLNQEENIKLAELRDSLLPRLMSGELDVSELDI